MRVFPIKGNSVPDLARDLEFHLNHFHIGKDDLVSVVPLSTTDNGTGGTHPIGAGFREFPLHALIVTTLHPTIPTQ